MISEREKNIGLRLRAFRETLQIPRTTFCVSIGCGTERIAAYEAGRARIPYWVFKAIAKRYDLSPRWLMDQQGSPQIKDSFDDKVFSQLLARGALFTDVYDRFLRASLKAEADLDNAKAATAIEALGRLEELLAHKKPESLPPRLQKLLKDFIAARNDLAALARKEMAARDLVDSKVGFLLARNDLTNPLTELKLSGVKPLWPALKRRLQSATSETGKKSELAKFLARVTGKSLDLTRVSQWLTESKSSREPGAEYALLMLHWVEQQERQK